MHALSNSRLAGSTSCSCNSNNILLPRLCTVPTRRLARRGRTAPLCCQASQATKRHAVRIEIKPGEQHKTRDCTPAAHHVLGSQGLLVLEAFAGSFPVARHFQHLSNSSSSSNSSHKQMRAACSNEEPAVPVAIPPSYHLAAYAAIELEAKYGAPTAAELGLSSQNFLDKRGSVSDVAVQVSVLEFIRGKLQDSKAGVSSVVVLGGPPCTAYSQAKIQHARNKLKQQQQAYLNALLQHAELARLMKETAGENEAAAAAAAANQARAAAEEAANALELQIEAAATETATAANELLKSDSLVQSFLALVNAIRLECKAAGNMPFYLIMENPQSTAEKALWNRPFMRDHLLHLPKTECTRGIIFQPKHHTAWLRPVRQNWCTYGVYPKKPTIIFTNLPDGVLTDRVCSKGTCLGKIPGKNQHQEQIKHKGGAHNRAKWPVEFVQRALQACVEAAGQVVT